MQLRERCSSYTTANQAESDWKYDHRLFRAEWVASHLESHFEVAGCMIRARTSGPVFSPHPGRCQISEVWFCEQVRLCQQVRLCKKVIRQSTITPKIEPSKAPNQEAGRAACHVCINARVDTGVTAVFIFSTGCSH